MLIQLRPSASNHALQKRLRNAMMIRPTTLLSHRASFATNVAAINPAPSTAITPEGLQGLHNFLASGFAARPAATASRMATASAAYRSQTEPTTHSPVSASVNRARSTMRPTPRITLRIIEVKINRFIGFLPLISDRFPAFIPGNGSFCNVFIISHLQRKSKLAPPASALFCCPEQVHSLYKRYQGEVPG